MTVWRCPAMHKLPHMYKIFMAVVHYRVKKKEEAAASCCASMLVMSVCSLTKYRSFVERVYTKNTRNLDNFRREILVYTYAS